MFSGRPIGTGIKCQLRLRTTRDRALIVEVLDQEGHTLGALDKVVRIDYRLEPRVPSKLVITVDSPTLDIESSAIIYESAASKTGEPRAKRNTITKR